MEHNSDQQIYLFDFDGTLVDSMPAFVSVMLRILQENQIEYPDDIVKIITPLGYAGTARYFQGLGLDLPEEEIVSVMNRYALDEYRYTIQAKPHVCAVLRQLKERGASLNVLTASPHIMLGPCLKRLGLYELFDNVWSCDDFCTTKADPEIQSLTWEDGVVRVRCSDVRSIQVETHFRTQRLALPKEGEQVLNEAEFDLSNWAQEEKDTSNAFFRMTLTDFCGNYAVTRAYWLDELT